MAVMRIVRRGARAARSRAALVSQIVLVVLVAAPVTAGAVPKRIVALTPFSANTLADIGVRPVAIGETIGGQARLSPKLNGVRRLALSHPAGPNLEQLAVLNAQLVLSSSAWQRGHGPMRRLGMAVAETNARSVAGAVVQTRQIGKLVARAGPARARARVLQRQITGATRGIRRRPSVLLILGVGRVPYAFLANSWGGDLVTRAGGRLLTRGLRAGNGFAKISNETVVQRNPDIIIAVPHGARSSIPRIAAYLKDNPAWRTTRAVRNNRVYVSTDDSLLEAGTDVAATIRRVRRSFLKN